jgi:hypothetical protein
MAEVAIPRQMFQEILRVIAKLRPQPPQRQHEILDGMQVQPTGAIRQNADENSQIGRSTTVWAA